MVDFCIVKSCSNNRFNVKSNTEFVSFFRLPQVEVMRQRWLQKLGEVTMPAKIDNARICSVHFSEDSFLRRDSAHIKMAVRNNRRRRLLLRAVPTLNLSSSTEEVLANTSQSKLYTTRYAELKVIRQEFKLPISNSESTVQHASHSLPGTSLLHNSAALKIHEDVTPAEAKIDAKKRVEHTPPADDVADDVEAEATFSERSERIYKAEEPKIIEHHDATCSKEAGNQSKAIPEMLNYDLEQDMQKCSSEEGTPACKRSRRFLVENLDMNKTDNTVISTEEDPANKIILLTDKINYLESLVNFYKSCKTTDQELIEHLRAQCAAYSLDLKKEQDKKKELFLEIKDLKKLNNGLYDKLKSARIKQTKSKEEQKTTIQAILSPYFTKGQIRCIIDGRKWVRWSTNDFAAAISLRNVSPKAYRYLRNKLNIPLPSVSSLQKWALSKFAISEGFLMDVLTVIRERSKSLTALEKITVLTFGEMALNQEICFNSKSEQMICPCAKVQVIMARGLMGNWKQPIYYKFDQPMTKSILNEAVSLLYRAGYQVVACTCDMENVGVWEELGINRNNHFFQHPTIPDAVVYIFADIPHLLKLLRNSYVDDGLNLHGCSETFTHNVLQTIVTQSIPSDSCITHRLTQRVLDARQTMRQAVWPAARIWSRSVAKAVEWLGKRNLLGIKEYQKFSDFILYVNDWFDVHNSQSKFGQHRGVNAYGIDIENQKRILALMTSYMETLRVGSRNKLMAFQKGIIISNASLRSLHEYLQDKFPNDYECILTRRLQQDVLQNFFSYIRAMGATDRNPPSGHDFKYRLRWYILGKHSHTIFTNNRNIKEDMSASCIPSSYSTSMPKQASTSPFVTLRASRPDERGCHTRHDIQDSSVNCNASNTIGILSMTHQSSEPAYEFEPDSDAEIILTEELFMNIINTSPDLATENIEDDINSNEYFENNIDNSLHEIDEIVEIHNIGDVVCEKSSLDNNLDNNLIHDAGLAYIAGYVAHRFRAKYRFLWEPTHHFEDAMSNDHSDWIQKISTVDLITQPSNALLDACVVMEKCFVQFHGNKFSRDVKVIQNVVELVRESEEYNNCLPEEVLQCLVRTRTYIRLREINKRMKGEKKKHKIDKNKKFSQLPKITLDAFFCGAPGSTISK